jgi:hypothetical protein
MDYDFIIRAGAVVAGVALLAGPRLVAVAKTFRLPVAAKEDVMADAHTILEIASRLKTAGNLKGVELCKSLIDTILGAKA